MNSVTSNCYPLGLLNIKKYGTILTTDWKTWKTWKMKVVMEKSRNMDNLPKVMEFYDQSWNLTNFTNKLYQICTFFATTKKISIPVASPHFVSFSAKCCAYKIKMRDGHGQSRRGKVREKSWENILSSLLEP